MNTKSFALKAATLSLTVAASLLNGQSLELSGTVPMDFQAAGQSAPAGSYRIVEYRAGVVSVRNARGQNIAIVSLQVQATPESNRNTLTFSRQNGSYHLSGYCALGRGCWTSSRKSASAEKIEIAMN